MSQVHTFIDPTSTSQLLNNLSMAIDETKLVRTINSLEDNIYKIEYSSGPSPRTSFLRKEVANLKIQLEDLRSRVVYE